MSGVRNQVQIEAKGSRNEDSFHMGKALGSRFVSDSTNGLIARIGVLLLLFYLCRGPRRATFLGDEGMISIYPLEI